MPTDVPPTALLVVLDGWGHAQAPAEPGQRENAIAAAHTPVWDRLWAQAPAALLSASSEDVGLPAGQMGNSEVGHMNLGAGRVMRQDLTRIDHAIATGDFFANPALEGAIDASLASGGALHVLGLLSPGGVHSHEDQIAEFVTHANKRGALVRLHAFLDGRDTPPKSAARSLKRFEQDTPGVIASIAGRYYPMDRDRHWDRVERAYDTLVRGEATFRFDDPLTALDAAYQRGETDEFVQPTLVGADDHQGIADGDAVVFMNFRADRARQLSRAFLADDFDGFSRERVRLGAFVTLTRYADDIEAPCAFDNEVPSQTLGEVLASLGKTQLRIAETEKYAHVTFFFSGGREAPFPGESRVLVPSPSVPTYDLAPAMSAREVTDRLARAIETGEFDAIVCNFAGGDMVGHTGVFDAAVQAVETIDECLGRIEAAVKRTGSTCLITADHGNVERMIDYTSEQPHTAHTSSPVPLVYLGPDEVTFSQGGTLADVAPTMLTLMGIPIPKEMTGRPLAQCAAAWRQSAG